MAKLTTVGHVRLDASEFADPGPWRSALAGESFFVSGSLEWHDYWGHCYGAIDWRVHKGVIVLMYRLPYMAGREVEEAVPVEQGEGRQTFFRCPGHRCGRRVRSLYLYGGYFRCRHCHDMVYRSQQERRPRELAHMDDSHQKGQQVETGLSGSGRQESMAEVLARRREESRERGRQWRRRYVQHTGSPGRPKEKRHYRHDDSRKVKLGPREAYCCKCRTARPYKYPRQTWVAPSGDEVTPIKDERIAIRARCRVCNTPVFRIVRPEEAEGLQLFLWG